MAEEEEPKIINAFPIRDSNDQAPMKNINPSSFQTFMGLVLKTLTPLSLSLKWFVEPMSIYLIPKS